MTNLQGAGVAGLYAIALWISLNYMGMKMWEKVPLGGLLWVWLSTAFLPISIAFVSLILIFGPYL
jgi:hypothetical protein